MNYKPIIVLAGEPNSIFTEIFFKALNHKKFKSPIILIGSYALIKLQMKKLKISKKIKLLSLKNLKKNNLDNKNINLINIPFNQKKAFEKISIKSNDYIKQCFKIALEILKMKISNKFINGPISKKFFLRSKYLGITEYLADKTKTKKYAMLIYNKNLSVSPLTTHLPLKRVTKKINKKKIIESVNLIENFFKKHLKKNQKLLSQGLIHIVKVLIVLMKMKKYLNPLLNFYQNQNAEYQVLMQQIQFL